MYRISLPLSVSSPREFTILTGFLEEDACTVGVMLVEPAVAAVAAEAAALPTAASLPSILPVAVQTPVFCELMA